MATEIEYELTFLAKIWRLFIVFQELDYYIHLLSLFTI